MLKTLEIKRIDIGSLFKVAFIIYAVVGLIAGFCVAMVFMMMGSLGSLLADEGIPGFGVLTGAAGIFAIPVLSMFYGVMGSVVVALVGLVYNLAAGRFGGLKLEMNTGDAAPVTVTTAPPSHT